MPLYGPTQAIISSNSQITATDISPSKLAFTSMGAHSRKISNQAIAHNTMTPVTFTDGESFDAVPSGYSGIHDLVTNPARWILRELGFWVVTASVIFEGKTGTGTSRYAILRKNGSTTLATDHQVISTASNPIALNMTAIVQATNVTDYVEVCAYHDYGSDVNVGDYAFGTFFSIGYLGNNS